MNLLSKAKRIVSLIVLSNIIMMSYAVIAYPGLVDFKPPDGEIVKIKMKGSSLQLPAWGVAILTPAA